MIYFKVFKPVNGFDNEELWKEFDKRLVELNIFPLFTNEDMVGEGSITVSYTDVRSIINKEGTYTNVLDKFSQFIYNYEDNKKYEAVMLHLLHSSNSFKGLMNKIQKIIVLEAQIDKFEKKKKNLWNIVFYSFFA